MINESFSTCSCSVICCCNALSRSARADATDIAAYTAMTNVKDVVAMKGCLHIAP